MDKIKQKARSLKKKYGTNDPFRICSELDVTVYYGDLPENVNGFFFKYFKNHIIVLNDTLSYEQRRITAAHELGHILLHGATNTFQLSAYTNLSVEKLEKQADYFASCLLIDDETMNYNNYSDSEAVTVNNIAQINRVPQYFVELYSSTMHLNDE